MGPIDDAYQALIAEVRARLLLSDFVASPDDLKVDPDGKVDTRRHGRGETCAALINAGQSVGRSLMGGGSARHLVDRRARVELAIAGGDRAWRDALVDRALTRFARLPLDLPTLGGACERLAIEEGDEDDLAPGTPGRRVSVTFTVRVRAADPLGKVAPV